MLIKIELETDLEYLKDDEKKRQIYVKEFWGKSYRQAITLSWALASHEETGQYDAQPNLLETDFYLEIEDDKIASSIIQTPDNIMMTVKETDKNKGFEVGDRVRVNGTFSNFYGEIGVIEKIDDNPTVNHLVDFYDGNKYWFNENALELVEEGQ